VRRTGDITLRIVGPELHAAVLALAPKADQERFCGRTRETLPEAQAAPGARPVAILEDAEPVGFFALHRGPAAGALTPSDRDVLLRGFFVDAAAQGRGVAATALEGLPAFMREHLPGARRVVLTVNVRNPAAIRTYARAGFADSGVVYHGGRHGPQHVLALRI
jgi:RimJ/RimL family protein N-acetyltransferase